MKTSVVRKYLKPYHTAARRHQADFKSLLWEGKRAQALRFQAITRLCNLNNKSVIDVGCGRADLLDYLLARKITPSFYTGIEAVSILARAARKKATATCEIVQDDFVSEPKCLSRGADVILFSGSLNTLSSRQFYCSVHAACTAAPQVVFNFLASPRLAGTDYLFWHQPQAIRQMARARGLKFQSLSDYIDGDCTISLSLPRPRK
jgi:hypothetical protein